MASYFPAYQPVTGRQKPSSPLDLYNAFNGQGSSNVSSAPSPANVSVNIPLSDVGVSVPYVLGRQLVSSPNVIWYGNIKPIYQTDTETKQKTESYYVDNTTFQGGDSVTPTYDVTTTETVSTTYIVGYEFDMQIGLCLGPDIKLRAIYSNKEKIWEGDIGPGRETITLAENDTALSGATLIFHGGAFDQTVDPVMTDADQPAYVGIAYVIIQNARADIALQNLQFEVEHYSNLLELSNGNNVIDSDINPVTAITDILINSWGGVGISDSFINITNFVDVAENLADSENMLSLIVDSPTGVKQFLSYILSQINGLFYQNPSTGKLEISLINDDALIFNENHNFGTSDIISYRDFQKTAWASTVNRLKGSYTNRDNFYDPEEIFIQTPNNEDTNHDISQVNYPFVMNAELCLQLLSRDLSRVSAPLFSLSIEVTRKAADLLPGDVAFVSNAKYRLYGAPILISKVRKLDFQTNTVVIEGAQYALPGTEVVYDVPNEPYNPDINFDPLAPETIYTRTAPYWIAKTAGILNGSASEDIIAPIFLPVPVNNYQATFDVYSFYNAVALGAPPTKIHYINRGIYPGYGNLSATINKTDGWLTGKLDELTVDGVVNPINFRSIDSAGVKAGKAFLFVDDEILSYETAAETGVNAWTFYNVHRSLLDTVVETHNIGSDVLLVTNNYSNVTRATFSYPLDSLPNWTIISNTANVYGSENVATTKIDYDGWHPDKPRTLAPVRPHDTKLNGVRNEDIVNIYVGDDITLTWKSRNRKASQVLSQTDTAETNEIMSTGGYQYHAIVILDSNGDETEIGETDTDASYDELTVTIPDTVALGNGSIFVRTKTDEVFDTLSSIYNDNLPINIYPNGLKLSEDETHYLISEDGTKIIVQEDA